MEYKIRPLGKTCASTGKPLVGGEVVYSALVERQGELERLDFSESAWTGPPLGTVGYWKCLVPNPEFRHASTINTETLLEYFEQLYEEDNAAQQKLMYVLMLFLLQRRRFRLDGSVVEEEVEYLEVSGSRGEGPYRVRDQQLSQDEIAELQVALSTQLSTNWSAA